MRVQYRRPFRTLTLLLLIALMGLLLTGTARERIAHVAVPQVARLRVVTTSPDAQPVDLYLSGRPLVKNLGYKQASRYVHVFPGTYRLQVARAGQGAHKALTVSNLTLEGGKRYTALALGKANRVRYLILTGDGEVPPTGKANVRFVHASPDAPAVDFALKGGPVLVSGLRFGEASQYTPLEKATYDLEVRLAGTESVIGTVAGFESKTGPAQTIMVVGEIGNHTVQSLILTDS